MSIQPSRWGSNLNPPLNNADKPESELSKIKSADAAADSFIFAQWNKIITGLKIIPPPIPIIPAKNPSMAPIANAGSKGNLIDFSLTAFGTSNIRAIAISRNIPRMIL